MKTQVYPAIGQADSPFVSTIEKSVGERFGLEFRTEFFNLFNHPHFGFPGTGFNGTATGNGFGQVTSTNPDSNPRLIQFALKLVF